MRWYWLFILVPFLSVAQVKESDTAYFCYPDWIHLHDSILDSYKFIHLAKNNFHFASKPSSNWDDQIRRVNNMLIGAHETFHIYHFGGSHIQADIYPNDVRTFLQTNWKGMPGERGLIFPFDLAKTNNPYHYRFTSSSKWKSYRSVVTRPEDIPYGVVGMVLQTSDSIVDLGFDYKVTDNRSSFDNIIIYHQKGRFPFRAISNAASEIISISTDTLVGITKFHLASLVDSFDIQFIRKDSVPEIFNLYGVLLTNEEPGFSYTSIGVNGASLPTYLQNELFQEQLGLYVPDMCLFSIGTNDANIPLEKFDPILYKANLEQLISKVLRVNPNCLIVLTVPNDAYYQKKHPNKNISRMQEMIYQLGEEKGYAVWDFYAVMGSLGSSKRWLKHGLMVTDYVHFTTKGYHVKGLLLIDAFAKFFEQMELETKRNRH